MVASAEALGGGLRHFELRPGEPFTVLGPVTFTPSRMDGKFWLNITAKQTDSAVVFGSMAKLAEVTAEAESNGQ